MYIEYIPGKKYIKEDYISPLPNVGHQKTAHDFTYTMKTMSEINDIE